MHRAFLILLIAIEITSPWEYRGFVFDAPPTVSYAVNANSQGLWVLNEGLWLGGGFRFFVAEAGAELVYDNNSNSHSASDTNRGWWGVRTKFCIPSEGESIYPFLIFGGRTTTFPHGNNHYGFNVGLGVGIPVSKSFSIEPAGKYDTYDNTKAVGLQIAIFGPFMSWGNN